MPAGGPDGGEVSTPMAVIETPPETVAAASSGPDADVWLRHDDKVFWLRMSCAP